MNKDKVRTIVITPDDLAPEPKETNTGKRTPIDWDEVKAVSSSGSGKAPVDIILLIDTSGSMSANDYSPNRLEAAKRAALDFAQRKVVQRYSDRVGVISFGGHPNLRLAVTSDMDSVRNAIDNIKDFTHDGTYLGPALSAAMQQLEKAGGNKRAVVLLSDGADEYDKSDPVGIARGMKNIKVFTVGIGTTKGGMAQLPHGMQKVFLNEKVLQQIADVTGGRYYYAPSLDQLREIYRNLADY